MADENKIRDAADAVKGIVEAVPVYQDVVQPAAKEIGTALQKITKLIHIVLSPLYALVWGYEKISAYLDEALAEKLKNVPEERIVYPSPAVAGPTLEALRFAAHEPSLREMYANLLATSMDSKTAHEAHPAFVEIIKQITPDEARLFAYMVGKLEKFKNCLIVVSGVVHIRVLENSYDYGFDSLVWMGKQAGCEHQDLLATYIDNLARLRILNIRDVSQSFVDYYDRVRKLENQARAEGWRYVKENYAGEIPPGKAIYNGVNTAKQLITLTTLGKQFYRACIETDRH